MRKLLKWKIRGFFLDIIDFITDYGKRFLLAILLIAYRVGIICFFISFYFMYKCYGEYKQGVKFGDMADLKLALVLFFVPIVVAVIKEVVHPKN